MSIGSYKHKKEMLDSVRLLLDMGYKLYGSMGTSDYYNEHGLFVETIDWMFGNNENNQVKYALSSWKIEPVKSPSCVKGGYRHTF